MTYHDSNNVRSHAADRSATHTGTPRPIGADSIAPVLLPAMSATVPRLPTPTVVPMFTTVYNPPAVVATNVSWNACSKVETDDARAIRS